MLPAPAESLSTSHPPPDLVSTCFSLICVMLGFWQDHEASYLLRLLFLFRSPLLVRVRCICICIYTAHLTLCSSASALVFVSLLYTLLDMRHLASPRPASS